MNKLLPIVIFGALTFLLTESCHAFALPNSGTANEKITLLFRKGSSLVIWDHGTNKASFERLNQLVAAHGVQPIDSISITGYASPDGSVLLNYKLSRDRAINLRGALRWRYPILKEQDLPITTSFRTANWDVVLSKIENDWNVPTRELALSILRSNDSDIVKEQKLKNQAPASYSYMADYIFPDLRSAVSCIIYLRKEVDKVPPTVVEISAVPVPETPAPEVVEPQPTPEVVRITPAKEKRPLFAVKTNLLSDIAITPNLELEIPIGKRWSINVEYQYAWWLNNNYTGCWQIESGGVEARYWFGDRAKRNVLTGWFAGVAASGGMYDFQLKNDEGNQGEYYTAGFTGGYVMPIIRNLNLEFSVGLGYVISDYKNYTVTDGVLFKTSDERFQSLFPTKAKISLVWVINRNSKTGGTK